MPHVNVMLDIECKYNMSDVALSVFLSCRLLSCPLPSPAQYQILGTSPSYETLTSSLWPMPARNVTLGHEGICE